MGSRISTLDLSATFAPANGGESFSAMRRWEGEETAPTKWPAAIANGSRSPVFTGVVILKSTAGDTLWIALPFPLVGTTPVPISHDQPSASGLTFGEGPPSSAGWASYQYVCTGLTREECAAQRYQSAQGTLTLVDASPLRVRIDAQIVYDGPRPADSFVGEITFDKDEGHRCLD